MVGCSQAFWIDLSWASCYWQKWSITISVKELFAYLESRLQVTRLGCLCQFINVGGVPSVSCSGPVLFNLFTTPDLQKCTDSCKAHLHLNDCQLHLSYKPEETTMVTNLINDDLQIMLFGQVRIVSNSTLISVQPYTPHHVYWCRTQS